MSTAFDGRALAAEPESFVAVGVRGGLGYRGLGKRLFDLCLAAALVPIALPVVAILMALVRLDGGPALFGHTRVGRGGAPFRCWKIRTMVPDAERRLRDHLAANPDAAAEWEAQRKLTDDPRITPIGRFLRGSGLDELPQLWNVATGDMSFVGARPVPRDELVKYGEAAAAYASMRPGITGIWQVAGTRNDVAYDERVAMDVAYARNASFALDLRILWKTAGTVVARTGR